MDTKIRDLAETYLPKKMPTWGYDVFENFAKDMLSDQNPFPCLLGLEGFKQRQYRFAFVDSTYKKKDLEHLANQLKKYALHYKRYGQNTSFIAFFQPKRIHHSEEVYQKIFRGLLQTLQELDDINEWKDNLQNKHNQTEEFTFHSISMHVKYDTPQLNQCQPTFMMVFQPKYYYANAQPHLPLQQYVHPQPQCSGTTTEHNTPQPSLQWYGTLASTNEHQDQLTNKTDSPLLEEPYVKKGRGSTLDITIRNLLSDETGYVIVHRYAPNTTQALEQTHLAIYLYIIEGSFRAEINGKFHVCSQGDCLYIPPNTVRICSTGDEGCLYVQYFAN
ncbi:hypothetical protein GLW08_07095 [Pontibacillus yanchengensis]|uniref:Uncharacterized protein n=2 Tax=Pontibacillus yanchengensis TaxID=462910 RepID=A0ACC7VFX0_9BACI|nr:YqcI/YcgG family protein [Pontibacillus yanchengensis]MYL32523.1 hypothetical protein [Pontibacillus yanchengensis]MYL53104.1 hypothetical protein [Pontibacillus yanchengensis]